LSDPKWPDSGVPVNDRGNVLSYDPYSFSGQGKRREVKPFTDTMTILGYRRGRSAAGFLLEGHDGVQYPIFMKDMVDVMQQRTITEGVIQKTQWTFCKRGSNYGVKLVDA
jgi:hypothetical protein